MPSMTVDNTKLHFGPYSTPSFRYGQRIACLARGEVTVWKLFKGRIPWPVGKTKRATSLILYGDLAKAVRRESNIAIRHWWGVGACAVWKWRKALRVPKKNEGDRLLMSQYGKRPEHREAMKSM
jgi:hypothetical protein